MALSLDEFKAKLTNGGARPNLFRVTASFPGELNGTVATEKMKFLCKSAQVPGSTLGLIAVPYMGRQLKLPGDRTFEAWNISVIADNDYLTRDIFEGWSSLFNQHVSNTAQTDVNALMTDWVVEHLDKTEKVISEYKLVGCWPSSIAPIELSYDNTDTIEEFAVTIEYQYWTHTSPRRTTDDNQSAAAQQ